MPKRNPLRTQVEASRAAGVSRGQLASWLTTHGQKRRRSAATVRQGVEGLTQRAGGTHARQLGSASAQRRSPYPTRKRGY